MVGLALCYFVIPWPAGIPVLGNLFEDTYEIEWTEYQPPPPKSDELLVDDSLNAKNPAFIPDLIDRRPEGDWRINASAAVLRVDVPVLKPDTEAGLLILRPSYAGAMAKAPPGMKVLPSVNIIDGKAKQFDDGLYAAFDLAYYKGLKPRLESQVAVIERLHERVHRESLASAYLAAGLSIAKAPVGTDKPDQVAPWLSRFESNAMYSKPSSFYTWSEELTRVFRFMRFFQQPLPGDKPELISELVRAVSSDPKLLEDYKRLNTFYAKLTNPLDNLTLVDVHERKGKPGGLQAVAVFPSCSNQGNGVVSPVVPRRCSGRRRLDEGDDSGDPHRKGRPGSHARQRLV